MSERRQHFQTRPDVRFRTIAGEGVIIRQEAGQAIVVNEVGARILDLLREGLSTEELIVRLTAEYDVEGGLLEQDIPGYLAELTNAGVIEPAQP